MENEFLGQKQRVGRLVNAAIMAITEASGLTLNIDSGLLEMSDVREDVIRVKADVDGSLECLSTARSDQTNYIQMEIYIATITGIVMDMKYRGVDIDMPATYLRVVDKFPKEMREKLRAKVHSDKYNGKYEKLEEMISKIITTKVLIQKEEEKKEKVKDFDVNATESLGESH
ncbi:Robl_LC7 domain-containing protein [Caenorhabditis elegans]|uniref:Robl_LC7 domain-containing protein n=1 Tax=Caenorhabditis elegans TaxID=6239 RepID=Q23374_CAEEL|nr:Robl_LC7 domain-containing protein [Caenorhabditis elegans]CCD61688.1 Robl_LC7 domain-containing protein [Caenorhabditis elegans]|eukprot:NP_508352.1 Uncharacterized protein CELE_ZC53.2 [Caenorhabditis elegans]